MFNSSNLRTIRSNALNQVEIAAGGQVIYSNRYVGLVSSYHNLRKFPFNAHDFEMHFGSIEDSIEEIEFITDPDNTFMGSRLELILSTERNPDFYLFRVLLLLVFVVAMSWTMFWVPPSRFEFQIGLGATSMLTSIAFYLAVGNSLPPLKYLTTLDQMLVWSIILVFLGIVESLISGLLVQADHESAAIKIDKVSRFAFPALLFGGWWLMANG